MNKLWHPSTELATRPGASCLIALPPPPSADDEDNSWFISPVFYNWHDADQCWVSEDSTDEWLEPGGRFHWAYEADVLAELETPETASHG